MVFVIAPQREVATYSTLGRHLTFLPKHRTSGARWNRLLTKTRFSYFYNPWIGCYFSASRLPRHPGRCLTRWLAWSSHLSNHLTVGLAPSTKIKSRTFFASGETLCLCNGNAIATSTRAHSVQWTYCCETSTLPTQGWVSNKQGKHRAT